MTNDIFIGGGGEDYATKQFLNIGYANRHGLIAGATGTGKTVTLQILAEGFSAAGVPVFLSDVKGDLSGLAQAGSASHKLHTPFTERAQTIGFDDFDYSAFPSPSGICTANRAIPSGRRFRRWARCCWRSCLDLTEAQEGILEHRLSCRRRRRIAASGPERFASAAGLDRRRTRRPGAALWQCVCGVRGRDPAAACWCWKTKGRRTFLVNLR